MEPHHRALYDQLVGYLAAEGEVSEDPVNGVLTITEYEHKTLATPLRLHLTPSHFEEALRDSAQSAGLALSEPPSLEAAWRLFTIHLWEAVETAKPGETELVLDRTGVSAKRPDEVAEGH